VVRGDAGRRREARRQLGCGCGRAHGTRGQVSIPLEPLGAKPSAGAAPVARAWAHNGRPVRGGFFEGPRLGGGARGHSRSATGGGGGTAAAAGRPSMTTEESVTTSDGSGGREELEPPNFFV
jgi:hypothetical protein